MSLWDADRILAIDKFAEKEENLGGKSGCGDSGG